MRLAGSPEVYKSLVKHFSSDGVPGEAAHHLASEMMVHGEEADTEVDRFFELFELLKSKGFGEDAAQHLAVEMIEGREPIAKTTQRYARVYGTASEDQEDFS